MSSINQRPFTVIDQKTGRDLQVIVLGPPAKADMQIITIGEHQISVEQILKLAEYVIMADDIVRGDIREKKQKDIAELNLGDGRGGTGSRRFRFSAQRLMADTAAASA